MTTKTLCWTLLSILSLTLPAAAEGAADPLKDARALRNQGKFAEAAEKFRAAWEADASLLAAHRGYQEAMKRSGQAKEVIEFYEQRASDDDSAVNQYLFGRIAESDREAVRVMGKAITKDSKFAIARACLASLLVEQGNAKKAQKEAEAAVTQAEANLAAAAGDAAKATATDDLATCLLTLGWVRENLEAADEAKADYGRALLLAPELAAAHASLGGLFETRGDLKDSIGAYQKAVELDPVSVHSICTLARLLNREAIEARSAQAPAAEGEGGEEGEEGEKKDEGEEADTSSPSAVALLEASIALMPDEAELHYTLGMVLADVSGSGAAAEKAYRHAIELSPKDVYYHSALSELLLKLGEPSKAVETAIQAVKLDQKNAEGFRALGCAYSGMKEWTKAADAFKTAMRLDPRDADLVLWLAETYESGDQVKEALDAYEQLAKMAPKDPEPHVRLGILYETKRSNKKEAIAHYEKYLQLGGTDPKVKEWIEQLKK